MTTSATAVPGSSTRVVNANDDQHHDGGEIGQDQEPRLGAGLVPDAEVAAA